MSDVKAVELLCTLAGSSRTQDRSASIRLKTMYEAPPELMAWLDKEHQAAVKVLIQAADMELEEEL